MARMLIVGSGIVGSATGKGFSRKGHQVSFVDINPDRVAKLRSEGLNAMTYPEVDWNAVDIVMIAVSTPSVNGKIVLDYIEAAAASPSPRSKTRLVIVPSQTSPRSLRNSHSLPCGRRGAFSAWMARAASACDISTNPKPHRSTHLRRSCASPRPICPA